MKDNNVAMLVELDYCVGCYACQSACQGENGLPIQSTYLRCILEKPESVDGVMTSYMSPVPYRLDKCAECMRRNDGEAPCSKICIGAALHFGTPDEIGAIARDSDSRIEVFC